MAAMLGSGNTFSAVFPTGFIVFRIRQWSHACESVRPVLESYYLKYCERVRYREFQFCLL